MNLFKKKPFRILCYATTISSFGDSLYSLACTLTVYALSGSLVGVAGMWLIRALIRIPSQFFAGIVADRYNRKKISIGIYSMSAVVVSLFLLLNDANRMFAYVLIFILQGTSDIDNMAQITILPEILEKEELPSANSIFQAIGTIVMLVGPGVGGILYRLFGSNVLYIIDAATFVFAALVMIMLPYQYQREEKGEVKFTLFSFAREGFQEIKKYTIIKIMILSTIFFGIMGRFYEIDKVYMADKVLQIGAEGIIFFSYAMAIGSLLAPLILKGMMKKDSFPVKTYGILSILTILSFVAWGNTTNLFFCLFANLWIGVFQTGMSIYVNIIFQKNIVSSCLGRVMSFYKISVVLSAIVGILLAPILVEWLGVGGSMGGVGGIALVFVIMMRIVPKQNVCS